MEALADGEAGTVIVEETPFYATSGGQVADTGIIRQGSNEFAVEDTVKLLGGKIDVYKRQTHCYEGYGTVSCSMGITFYPKDGIWFEELYQKADLALYEAKHSGRSCYKFYRVPFEQNGQNVC